MTKKQIIYLCRPKTLALAIAAVSSSLLIQTAVLTPLQWLLFILTVAVACSLQILANLANDYSDFIDQTDAGRTNSNTAPERLLATGEVSPGQLILFGKFLLAFTVLGGLVLVLAGGWPILAIGLSALVLALLYSYSCISLNKTGLAELVCLLYFGPLAVAGTDLILNGSFSTYALQAGLLPGFYAVALLSINNLRDIETDIAAKRKNLIQLLGSHYGLWFILLLLVAAQYLQQFLVSQFALQFVSIFAFVFCGINLVRDLTDYKLFFKTVTILAASLIFCAVFKNLLLVFF